MTACKTCFDSKICKLTNIKLLNSENNLNSEFYPYDDLNLVFDKRRATILYDMYICFRTFYYQILSREKINRHFN